MKWVVRSALFLVLIALPSLSVAAEPAPTDDEGPAWHGDIRTFAVRDFETWRRGYWIRGARRSDTAWWWIVGETWYPYEQVTYPFPDPYTPSPFRQPTILGKSRPEPGVLTDPYLYFYCPVGKTYYPYVAECAEGWLPVRATEKGLRDQAQRSARAQAAQARPTHCRKGQDDCV